MKIFQLFLVSFWWIYPSMAQDIALNNSANKSIYVSNLKPISVGDQVPDILLSGILNYKTTQVRISDFKGKLLILDFWATWCSPCISSFPKLDSLQKKYNEDIQILPVTYENEVAVSVFLDKLRKIKHISVPTVTNDKILSKLFKHTIIPHYVWIDGNQKVVAITESKDVTEENIKSYKNSKTIHYSLKQEGTKRVIGTPGIFNPSLQLKNSTDKQLELKKMEDSSVMFHSVLTKYTEGIGSGASFVGEGGDGYILVSNRTIQGLYRVALLGNSMESLNATTMIVEIADSGLHKKVTSIGLDGSKPSAGLEALDWLKENGYCYELKVPHEMAYERFNIMLHELNRYFGSLYGIEGLLEKRVGKYLALIRTSDKNKMTSTSSEKETKKDKFSIVLKNEYLSALLGSLAIPLQTYPPIIDETGFKEKVDIELNCQLSDLNSLNKELSKYDMQLIEKSKLMNFAVIRSKRH